MMNTRLGDITVGEFLNAELAIVLFIMGAFIASTILIGCVKLIRRLRSRK